MVSLLLSCVLQILSGGPRFIECHQHTRAVVAAYAIQDAVREYPSVPGPILAAVMAHESGFDPSARGSSGEVGLGQVLPRTAGMNLSVAALSNPRVNAIMSARYLSLMQHGCHGAVRWLSRYNGGRCRRGEYGDKVLVLLRGAK